MNLKFNVFSATAVIILLLLISPVQQVRAQTCSTPAYDLDQGKNGSASSPLNPVQWVNGNLNASQSHFVEGYSIPYRVTITGLVAGQCYCIQLE